MVFFYWYKGFYFSCVSFSVYCMGYAGRNGVRASSEVRRAIRAYRKEKTSLRAPCVACGRSWRWYRRFHVHHLFPVGRFPERAADEETFRWVHAKCHLVVGHGGVWGNYQSKFDELADLLRSGLEEGG